MNAPTFHRPQLPVVFSTIMNSVVPRLRILPLLTLLLGAFLLPAQPAAAQTLAAPGSAAGEWQRIRDGLAQARPAPEPESAPRLERAGKAAGSGKLVQFNLNLSGVTGESIELAARTADAPAPGNHIEGLIPLAPQAMLSQADLQTSSQISRGATPASPEGFGTAGVLSSQASIAPRAPQPYLAYAFPFNTQLRLLTRFNVGGVDYYYTCSASQAADFHLLTAAHCIYNHDPKGDGSGEGAGFAVEAWAWLAGSNAAGSNAAGISAADRPDFPYGIAKVAYQSAYEAWIESSDLDWDVAFLTLDRRLGDHTGWMGREWETTANSLNFDGYPAEAPSVSAANPFQYPGYDAVAGYTCCRIEMNALTYGGEAGGGVWRSDPADGSRYVEGVNSTTDSAGHAAATRLTPEIEAGFEWLVARDRSLHSPSDLPELIEYTLSANAGDSKALIDTTVKPGGTFRVKLNAFNAGFAAVSDATAAVYLTKDPDNVAAGAFLQVLDLGALDAYSYTIQTRVVSMPAGVAPGNYYVGYVLSTPDRQYGTDRTDVVIYDEPLAVSCGSGKDDACSGTPASLASLKVVPNVITDTQGATGTVLLTGPAPAGGLPVNLSSTVGIVHIPSQILVPEGATSATFPIATSYVLELENVVITASAQGVSDTADLTVYAYPSPPESVTCLPSTVVSGDESTCIVTLKEQAPEGGEKIQIESGSPDIHAPTGIFFFEGDRTRTFTAQTDTEVQAISSFFDVFAQIGGDVKGLLDALPASLYKVSFNPSTLVGGADSTGTIELTGKAPAGGAVINLAFGKPDVGVTLPDGPTVTSKAGETKATFRIKTTAVKADSKAQITATYKIGDPKTATMTITAVLMPVSVTIAPNFVVGGAPNATTGTVKLNAAAAADTKIALMSSDVKLATVPDSVTIKAGAISATFPIKAPNMVIQNQNVTITATLAGQKPVSATLEVRQLVPDSLALIPPGMGIVGGKDGLAIVTLNGIAPDGGVKVTTASDNPNATLGGMVEVATGKNSGTFAIPTKKVTAPVEVTITVSLNGSSKNLKIVISPVALTKVTLSPANLVGGTSSVGTVTLSDVAPAGGIVVNLTTSNAAAAKPLTPTVTVPAGQKTADFKVTTNGVKIKTEVTITGAYGGFTEKAPTLIVNSPDLKSVSVPATVKGGNKATVTVTLDGPAPPGGIAVSLSSSNANFPIPANTKVTVNAGDTTGTYQVTTKKVNANVDATVTATYNLVAEEAKVTVTK